MQFVHSDASDTQDCTDYCVGIGLYSCNLKDNFSLRTTFRADVTTAHCEAKQANFGPTPRWGRSILGAVRHSGYKLVVETQISLIVLQISHLHFSYITERPAVGLNAFILDCLFFRILCYVSSNFYHLNTTNESLSLSLSPQHVLPSNCSVTCLTLREEYLCLSKKTASTYKGVVSNMCQRDEWWHRGRDKALEPGCIKCHNTV